MGVWIFVVHLQLPAPRFPNRSGETARGSAQPIDVIVHMGDGDIGVRRGKIRIDRDRTSQQAACFNVAALGLKQRLLAPAQEEVVGLHVDFALPGQSVFLFPASA